MAEPAVSIPATAQETAVLLSVIVPTFNYARYIGAALDSIFSQDIPLPSMEVIVVDDASTDDTAAVLARQGSRIRVISRADNAGAAAARNTGLAAARGSVIGFLDADDLWTVGHLRALLAWLATDSPYDLVRGRTRTVTRRAALPDLVGEDLLHPILVGACLYRASVFQRVGVFDESLRQGEDVDLNARIAEAGLREARVDEAVLVYRRHGQNTARASEEIIRGQLDAIRKRLARAAAHD
jgi:glycosyltransferase involved in cell wall biosynthesis